MSLSKNQKQIALDLLHLFLIDGRPADEVATEGQIDIFGSIVFEINQRIHIETATQYGKSLFVALAAIVLSTQNGDMVTIVAPTEDKARIIMRYYISHVGDASCFSELLDKETKLEALQMETTKERIVLRNKGGINIISLQAHNSKKGFEAAMGEGSSKLILDEACLVPDMIEATAFRMISGKEDPLYVKIGNPFYRTAPYTHFFKSSNDPRYLKIHIDYRQGLEEGRYSAATIDEAKGKPLFNVLYECKFPELEEQDDDGFILLFTEPQIQNAYLNDTTSLEIVGEKRMGIDLAGGGRNYSTIVIRGDNLAKLVYRNRTGDPMVLYSKAEELARKYDVPFDDDHVFPDKTGSIAWCARLNELHPFKGNPPNRQNNFGIVIGEKPEIMDDQSEKQFLNLRAQASFRARDWLLQGGKLIGRPYFDEAINVRYKVQSDKKYQMQSKDLMRKNGIESPDCWDALVLTFARKRRVIHKSYKQADVQQDKFGLY